MATSTVVVTREDLKILGLSDGGPPETDPQQIENEFFKTLQHHKADAVVLDLTAPQGQGVAAILKIRRGSAVPIIVICGPGDRLMPEYRQAGAIACMTPPIDLMRLTALQKPSAAG